MSDRMRMSAKTTEKEKESKASGAKRPESSKSAGSVADRILFLQTTVGNKAVQRMIASGSLQAKLSVSKPGDIYEQEADRVAEDVMRMPDRRMVSSSPGRVGCSECAGNKQVKLKRSKAEVKQPSGHNMPRTLDEIGEQLSATSHPMDTETHVLMRDVFDTDFSGVRIHSNSEAQLAAQVMRADAFTIGSHVFFARDKYNPKTSEGKSLIAHELTHVIQQGNASVSINDSVQGEKAVSNLEHQADTMAQHVADMSQESSSKSEKPAISRSIVKTTPLGFLLRGKWRKEGQGLLDCINECTSSQGFAATMGGILAGICGVIAVLVAAAAAPETGGTASIPAAILAAAACAGFALGVPTGIMGGCMWDCRG